MYIVTPFPNELHALDLTASGARKWTYKPPYLRSARGVACCDVVNRGAAYWDGKVYFVTLDNQVAAVDAVSGKEVWRVRLGDINHGETMTMAPLIVKGMVLVGNSGGEMGVRGWLTALSAATGDIAWRAYSTGPDSEALIGDGFRPFYASDSGTDLGTTTWPGEVWQTGGGTVWGWISYDPELDLIYHGTGNPGPWNPEQRPGDNKWTSGVFARDPDTGAARWFYQWSPHDLHDYDGINESILLDLPIEGRTRAVLVRPERNGYMYVLDRATGEVLSATLGMMGVAACLGAEREVRAAALTGGEPERGTRAHPAVWVRVVSHDFPASPAQRRRSVHRSPGIAARAYLGGVLENSPANMMQWIQNPKAIDEKTAMPDLGVTPEHARDIASYLYTLH